jgi:predicted membrane-bound spermidine synthase
MGYFFLFFFVSGFCSILYEIVWLRLSMAQFGVTSALVSIVLSMFMAGLGLGSWIAGRVIRRGGDRLAVQPLRIYALVELLIGVAAIVVPYELQLGRHLLEHVQLLSSWSYYLASGACVACALVPWCACMGATFPLVMLATRQTFPDKAQRSFSFLYLANVLGAVAGAMVPLLLIEVYGFHGTLKVGALLNCLLAASALAFTLLHKTSQSPADQLSTRNAETVNRRAIDPHPGNRRALILLFATGLTSMGVEVVWIRQFTPYLGTLVYAFASILAAYLAATFLGSQIYRFWSRDHSNEGNLVWLSLGLLALLPAITTNPHLGLPRAERLLLGIVPFSAVMGFVTPMLVDRWSGGNPDKAGRAYAINVVGCILGPLLSGFVLLPLMGERWVLGIFALPWLLLGVYPGWSSDGAVAGPSHPVRRSKLSYAIVLLAPIMLLVSKGYDEQFRDRRVLRDNTATIVAFGQGMAKRLLINGVGITSLTEITKVMAHLPLAYLDHPPQKALTICFGMGTTYRSLLSWGVPTTVVELVPSVPRMFGYYFSDAKEVMGSPLSHVVIDDGRRYLERSSERYDVITLDPPPPVQAAGSSLLYSKEFYSVVRKHLQPGGILQQWIPEGDPVVLASVSRALKESFPYVRVFEYGHNVSLQFLASDHLIPDRTPLEMEQRMPLNAARDMMEWYPGVPPQQVFTFIVQHETSIDQVIALAPGAPSLQDDRPMNEYFLLRELAPNVWRN